MFYQINDLQELKLVRAALLYYGSRNWMDKRGTTDRCIELDDRLAAAEAEMTPKPWPAVDFDADSIERHNGTGKTPTELVTAYAHTFLARPDSIHVNEVRLVKKDDQFPTNN